MSLVTRCPSCATTFKVVKDQLRISDGWVRCGRCSHVFDASLDVHELPEAAASVAPSLPTPPLPDDADFFDDEPLPEPAVSAPAPLEMPEPEAPPTPDVDDYEDVDEKDEKNEKDKADEANGPEVSEPLLEHRSASVSVPMQSTMPMSSYDLDVFGPVQRKEPRLAEPPLHAGPIVLPRTLPGLPSIGLVADEPWPEVVTPQLGNRIESSDVSRPLGVPAHLQQDPENTSQIQFQKALRRARDKAAKIAKSRERAAVQNSSPMPLMQSESESENDNDNGNDNESDKEGEAMSSVAMSATAESAPMTAPAHITIPALLRAASESPAWRSRKGRAWLAAGSVAALLLLVLQVLHQERDAIVARQPGMRPLLAGVCAITGCQLSALRQIGDITIDGAAFAREKVGDGYRLSFTLRNAASVPLAMPAIELSLLDTQEQAVVRRVLLPADFGAPAELAARGERVASMPLALDAAQAASLPPVAGYRLVAFYP